MKSHLSVCNLPPAWTEPATWVETCTQPTTVQVKSNSELPTLSELGILLALVIFGWRLGVAIHRRYCTYRMITQLYKIIALERMLRINSDKV